MGFRTEVNQQAKPGKKITIHVFGIEYSGTVVRYDKQQANDVSLVIESDDGKSIITVPISPNVVVILPKEIQKAQPVLDDDPDEVVDKKKKTGKK